ncbi:hypothetical protein PHYSODRAFT_324719 [Phytophthora sojae]|uniref:HTH CENPB-type domain-containing protein n=1 Tax=Phytophthora sojae (strain P6497) TaxID=1094619 RepID=G4YSM8_PHYSP|nr:hypothetical protein PHYSODRAFT_324719 [Phytophthora sojae]EGZ23521.1 hypothetical protein PHYSODRAFT_324719 [Phytophthora sojae]|eukprot:XP_009518809.1 hypothetical protein PHYSODRAFT_324719 [Phytophthora sojae]
MNNPMLAEWIYATFKARVSRATLARLRNLPSSYFSHVDLSATKRRRVKFPQFERELREFFFLNEAKTAMADDVLLLKAHELAERLGIDATQLRLSNGWLPSFKKRNGIRSHTLHGEGGAVEADEVRDARLELQELVAQFTPKNGKKKEKQRLTLAFYCNATSSDKLDPIVIGTAKNPRCFKKGAAIKGKSILYKSSKDAWMTSVIFDEWLHLFNMRMAAANRKVLLLVDNASCHKILRNLTHVTVHFLPPNMTSAVLPLDAANITRKLNVLEAVQFSIDAWAGVTPTTITNCWVKTRILGGKMLGRTRADTDYIEEVSSNEMEELTAMLSRWEGAVSASEYLAVDEDVPVHEPDVLVDEAAGSDAVSQDEQEEEEEQEPAVQPAIALRHCMELAAFLLQCGEQTDRDRRALQTVTALVRETTTRCCLSGLVVFADSVTLEEMVAGDAFGAGVFAGLADVVVLVQLVTLLDSVALADVTHSLVVYTELEGLMWMVVGVISVVLVDSLVLVDSVVLANSSLVVAVGSVVLADLLVLTGRAMFLELVVLVASVVLLMAHLELVLLSQLMAHLELVLLSQLMAQLELSVVLADAALFSELVVHSDLAVLMSLKLVVLWCIEAFANLASPVKQLILTFKLRVQSGMYPLQFLVDDVLRCDSKRVAVVHQQSRGKTVRETFRQA